MPPGNAGWIAGLGGAGSPSEPLTPCPDEEEYEPAALLLSRRGGFDFFPYPVFYSISLKFPRNIYIFKHVNNP